MYWRQYQSFLLIACLFLIACASKQSAQRPDIHYADSYPYQVAGTLVDPIEKAWWQSFESSGLNQLILDAEKNSVDILIAAERVRQAELQMRIASASVFPSLTAQADTGERRAENSSSTIRTESTSASLNISYEVDLWGGIAANRASAKATFDATRFDQDAAVLSTKAAIASSWFQWLALQERMTTAQKNIAIAERVQHIVDARYRNGVATAAEVAQQQTNLLTQQASLLPLELQARQTRSALAILLGKTPQAFSLPTENILSLKVPSVESGTPAGLVTRRPDLAAREADLTAANANVVAARTALLPSVGLNAGVGKSASELFRLNPALQSASWSLSLAQTVFNGGRVVNATRLSESEREGMLLHYHKAILVALQEVDDGLASADINSRQEVSQQAIVVHAERSLRLTEARYREGSDDLLSLLDAQRNLFQAQDALVQQRLARLNAAVNLYKALGGGWVLH